MVIIFFCVRSFSPLGVLGCSRPLGESCINVKYGNTFTVHLTIMFAIERKIIHLNIVDFSTTMERLHNRGLQTRALIIAERSSPAVVYDMSDEGYGEGVRKGMALSVAVRGCRSAMRLPPRPVMRSKLWYTLEPSMP